MSASSLLLLLILFLCGCLPQLSRTLGNLNEITALVLSATLEVSVNLLPVEVSSPERGRSGSYKTNALSFLVGKYKRLSPHLIGIIIIIRSMFDPCRQRIFQDHEMNNYIFYCEENMHNITAAGSTCTTILPYIVRLLNFFFRK